MKLPWHYMTVADWLVVLALLGAALAGVARVAAAPGGTRVVVTRGGETLFTAPLGQPRSFDVEGPLGLTHLVIDAQGVRITSSPCPRKICMTMGPARHSGDLLACVPNRILVRIDQPGPDDGAYDLLSR